MRAAILLTRRDARVAGEATRIARGIHAVEQVAGTTNLDGTIAPGVRVRSGLHQVDVARTSETGRQARTRSRSAEVAEEVSP